MLYLSQACTRVFYSESKTDVTFYKQVICPRGRHQRRPTFSGKQLYLQTIWVKYINMHKYIHVYRIDTIKG